MKFILNQAPIPYSKSNEITTLKWLLERTDEEEKYEVSALIVRRLEKLTRPEDNNGNTRVDIGK